MNAAQTIRQNPIRKSRNYSRRQTKKAIINTISYILLITGAIISLIPFIWMISTSLKGRAEVFIYPPNFIPETLRWDNYSSVFSTFPFFSYMRNTATVAVSVTIIQLVVSATAAYAFARLDFKGRNALFFLFLGTLMVPSQVTLIPSYIMMTDRFLALKGTLWALILPSGLGGVAFGTFMLRQFMLGIPKELEEAALIDGASPIVSFFKIILPLSKPALATLAVFTFMGSWNEFLWPLLMLERPELQTLTVGLAGLQTRWGTRWPELMAGSLVSIVPILLITLFAQRYFIRGIVVSGLKG
jgi:multiple sugar transport system permease protein